MFSIFNHFNSLLYAFMPIFVSNMLVPRQEDRVEPHRYYELFERDNIKFGNSRYGHGNLRIYYSLLVKMFCLLCSSPSNHLKNVKLNCSMCNCVSNSLVSFQQPFLVPTFILIWKNSKENTSYPFYFLSISSTCARLEFVSRLVFKTMTRF